MRHLIVCCDGTWQRSDSDNPTNVRRLADAVAPTADDGTEQVVVHVPGVGADSAVGRIAAGIAGVGLSRAVTGAYRWLVQRYVVGDRISLFGFSRGAFTARSLAGMIGACGLVDPQDRSDDELGRLVTRIHRERYRAGEAAAPSWRDGLHFRYDPRDAADIPVWFIGVWETVGSLGVPDHLGVLNLIDSPSAYAFHDVRLNPHIAHARHAVALDERRGPFAPTLWAAPEVPQDVRQVWFPGHHGDVGGGPAERGLSDGALRWMVDEATAAVGLAFDERRLAELRPDPLVDRPEDVPAEPGLAVGLLEAVLQPRPRAVPLIDPDERSADVHASAYERALGRDYRPTTRPAPGGSRTVEVRAADRWTDTGLYLEQSVEYRFTATGEWHSRPGTTGPAGAIGGLLRSGDPAQILGTLVGRAEWLFRRVSGNPRADLLGARREEDLPWMSLVGILANERTDADGKLAHPHERIPIGASAAHRPARSGYLYVFGNDAWGCYGNNDGSVLLTVTRPG